MRALRDAIPDDERAAASREIARRMLDLPETRGARSVFVFRSFGSEVDTHGLIDDLLASGRRVSMPVLAAGRLEAAAYATGAPLVASGYGAMEPANRSIVDPTEIDLVVVPGLAFDRTGHRLGYGGGYYDGYLPRVPAIAPRVAVAFHRQVLDDVPHGDGDHPVDVIVTEQEIVRIPRD